MVNDPTKDYQLLSPPCADYNGTPPNRLLTEEERAERLAALEAITDVYDGALDWIDDGSDRDIAEIL